jgi:ABC-type nitrate/sulfonate/bicarbonate transport system substrate-binding protein
MLLIRVILALLVAAIAIVPHAIFAQDTPAIRLSTVPIDGGAEPYYAAAQGFFKANGLNVEVTSASQGAAILPGVTGGAVDIGFANMGSLASAVANGAPLTLIAPASLYLTDAPTTVCLVATSSPYKTAASLNGKTVGTSGIKGLGEYGPRSWMDKNGGDGASLKFAELPLSAAVEAMNQGKVDMIAVSEPFVTVAKQQGRVIGKCYDGIAPRFLIGAFFTTTAWANAHQDVVKKFAVAIRQTAAWANKNDDKTAQILADASKVDVTLLRKSVRAIYADRLDPKEIQPLIDVMARYGGLNAAFSGAGMIYKAPQ